MGKGKILREWRIVCERLCILSFTSRSSQLQCASSPALNKVKMKTPEVWAIIEIILLWIVQSTSRFYRLPGFSPSTCIHGGVKFKHGDYFLPDDPVLTTKLSGQCFQCHCHDGLVVCEIENCPQLNCEKPTKISQLCCLQCPTTSAKQEKPTSLSLPRPKLSKVRKNTDCISEGKYFKEGSSWQPVIGPLGVMACVQCTCKGGEVNCRRFQCRELPCSHPRKQFGQCCPVCPMLVRDDFEGGSNCLPRSSEVFIFKNQPLGKMHAVLMYGFVLENSRNKIEVHTWDTRQSASNIFNVSVSFKSNLHKSEMRILGSTSYKHWTRYARREKRLKEHCQVKCLERVDRLEETLKLYPIQRKIMCNAEEIDTTTI